MQANDDKALVEAVLARRPGCGDSRYQNVAMKPINERTETPTAQSMSLA